MTALIATVTAIIIFLAIVFSLGMVIWSARDFAKSEFKDKNYFYYFVFWLIVFILFV